MTPPRVGVIGAGYVGLTTAVCLAERGLGVVCVEVDSVKLGDLRRGVAVIEEPELPRLLRRGLYRGLLRLTGEYADLVDRDAVIVCVPTPSQADGMADVGAVETTMAGLAAVLPAGAVVARKSTVPVGTCRRMSGLVAHAGIRVGVQSRVPPRKSCGGGLSSPRSRRDRRGRRRCRRTDTTRLRGGTGADATNEPGKR